MANLRETERKDWLCSSIGALLFTTGDRNALDGSLRRLFVRRGAFGGAGDFAAKPKDSIMPKRSFKRPTPVKASKLATSRKIARKPQAKLSKAKQPDPAEIALPEELKAQPSGRADSKQSKVLASLRAPAGATLDAMMKATGWQQHSVRGFLACVVRKKLSLNLVSEAGDNGRVYRIIGDAPRLQDRVQPDQA